MAKFCTNCGKPLKEGTPCDCKKNIAQSKSNDIVNNLLTVLKGTFKNPIETMKNIKSENYFVTGIITLAVSALSMALFLAGILNSIINTFLNNSVGSIVKYTTNVSSQASSAVFGIGVRIVFLAAVFYALYSLIAWIITNKIMKRKNTYKEIIATLAVPATISATSMLASWLIVLLFGSSTGGTILYSLVFSFGQVLFTVYLYHSLIIATDVKEDYAGYTHFASMFISLFIVGIITGIMISSLITSSTKMYTPQYNNLFGYNNILK